MQLFLQFHLNRLQDAYDMMQ